MFLSSFKSGEELELEMQILYAEMEAEEATIKEEEEAAAEAAKQAEEEYNAQKQELYMEMDVTEAASAEMEAEIARLEAEMKDGTDDNDPLPKSPLEVLADVVFKVRDKILPILFLSYFFPFFGPTMTSFSFFCLSLLLMCVCVSSDDPVLWPPTGSRPCRNGGMVKRFSSPASHAEVQPAGAASHVGADLVCLRNHAQREAEQTASGEDAWLLRPSSEWAEA